MMYYYNLKNCKRHYYLNDLKKECELLLSPHLDKVKANYPNTLHCYWSTKPTFGYVLCDFITQENGLRLIGKGCKKLFDLVQNDIDFLILSDKSEKLSQIMSIDNKKVLVLNITNFRWLLKTFSNQDNSVKLILNKFNEEDGKTIIKWFRASIGQMNIEEVKEITSDVQTLKDEEVIKLIKHDPTLIPKIANFLKETDTDIVTLHEFLKALKHIEHIINSRNMDKITELLTLLKTENPETIDKLNKHLREVTLDSINNIISITKSKINALNKFKEMLENPLTYEVKGHGSTSIHEFLEDNPWIMGEKYELYTSDKRIKELVKKKMPRKLADLKPDFVLIKKRDEKESVIVEIKRPKNDLNVDDVQQVMDYKKILKEYMPNVKVWKMILVGGKMSQDLTSRREDYNLEIKTYTELYSETEDKIKEYLEAYKERRKEISHEN